MRYPRLLPTLTLSLFLAASLSAGEAVVASVTARTDPKIASENTAAKVWFRVPANYDPKSRNTYRVMVYFGGRNCSGENEARNGVGFAKWADDNDIFIVAPGFKNDEYWMPEKWAGVALRNAIAAIKKNYKINDQNLLFYGYSAGGQASALFPFWQPDRTRAWVSHANGIFAEPSKRMVGVPGLITCGDADLGRYGTSRLFVERYRSVGINVIWKSYPNIVHEVPANTVQFAQDFLLYYHLRHIDDLKPGASKRLGKEAVEYVGDDMESRFWPANTQEAQRIFAEDRVEFPSRELADAWGTPGAVREEPIKNTRRGR